MSSHHHHEHHHDHTQVVTSLNRVFILGIALNIAYVLAEAIAGICFNSMGLLSDAGHNLTDVVSLALAMLAYRLSQTHANHRFTYGYKKSTVLISLLNAIILGVAVVFIIVESIHKLIDPEPLEGITVSIVAAIGVAVNGFTAYLFMKDRKQDLNIKGAFLHMLADALVSVGVVISGIIIHFTGWYIIDAFIGLTVAVVIVVATWQLLRDSLRLALDGVPTQVDYDRVVSLIKNTDGVLDVHHLHIWAISTTENALTAHVVIRDIQKMETVKAELKHALKGENISHATLEFEMETYRCPDQGD